MLMDVSPLGWDEDTGKGAAPLGYSEAAEWDTEVNKRFTSQAYHRSLLWSGQDNGSPGAKHFRRSRA